MIEQRLFALRAAARKHQTTIAELPAVLADMRGKLEKIELGEDGLNECLKREEECRLAYVAAAEDLSEKRRQAAAQLDWKVMEELPPLKMETTFLPLIFNCFKAATVKSPEFSTIIL